MYNTGWFSGRVKKELRIVNIKINKKNGIIIEYFRELLDSFKKIGGLLILLLVTAFFSFIIVFPLWYFSIHQRPVFNIFVFSVFILVFLIYIINKIRMSIIEINTGKGKIWYSPFLSGLKGLILTLKVFLHAALIYVIGLFINNILSFFMLIIFVIGYILSLGLLKYVQKWIRKKK